MTSCFVLIGIVTKLELALSYGGAAQVPAEDTHTSFGTGTAQNTDPSQMEF